MKESLTCDFRQVHLDQLAHVKKGCVVRPRSDIATDGSRIEGTHPGWNALMHGKACGIRVFIALSHDHVLQRNIRVSSKLKSPSPFVKSTFSSHHIHLVDCANKLWNKVIKTRLPRGSSALKTLARPELAVVGSNEVFGLASSQSVIKDLDGLLTLDDDDKTVTVKEELDGDVVDTTNSRSFDETILQDTASDADRSRIVSYLNIDPALLQIPLQPSDSTSSVLSASRGANSASAPIPVRRSVQCTQDNNVIVIPNSPEPVIVSLRSHILFCYSPQCSSIYLLSTGPYPRRRRQKFRNSRLTVQHQGI